MIANGINTPLIEQRADPFIYRHTDGSYYFTASVPAYDSLVIRHSYSIEGLAQAKETTVWKKPEHGPFSDLIWAPEIHYNGGAWYIYFAAAPSREIKDDLFQHRMYVISTTAENPLTGEWSEPVQIDTGIDSFCLDATTFYHKGQLYYLWAQKGPGITGNSNLYLAPMETPLKLAAKPVLLSKPELEWEIRGFWVNEGPAVVTHGNRIFITYSASATDENYCMGMLWADLDDDLMNPASWSKSSNPVFQTCYEDSVFGPGHNSFTKSEDGTTDILVYHARTYTEIVGDPLWDPNRHTYVKALQWDSEGFPVFGTPSQK
ncbi:MAG: family 43 glycosylhydrolase [Opitutales bacterium]|nr:family 43 glycosylhydrolase [Opitutales bacterium]